MKKTQSGNSRRVQDEFGAYRITGVPEGEVEINVFYTGLNPRSVTVTVESGSTVTRDIGLSTRAASDTGEMPRRAKSDFPSIYQLKP